jgi:hypothetical protein
MCEQAQVPRIPHKLPDMMILCFGTMLFSVFVGRCMDLSIGLHCTTAQTAEGGSTAPQWGAPTHLPL